MFELIKKYWVVFVSVILIILCGGIYIVFFQKPKEVQIVEIDKLYIYHSGMGWTTEEYKIDFVEKTFWEYHTGVFERYVERNPDAENEGFTFTGNLSDKEIEKFMRMSSLHGFQYWEEKYNNEGIADGHQWGMTIYYQDGTIKKIWGSNAYPKSWEEIGNDLKNLTGVDIL